MSAISIATAQNDLLPLFDYANAALVVESNDFTTWQKACSQGSENQLSAQRAWMSSKLVSDAKIRPFFVKLIKSDLSDIITDAYALDPDQYLEELKIGMATLPFSDEQRSGLAQEAMRCVVRRKITRSHMSQIVLGLKEGAVSMREATAKDRRKRYTAIMAEVWAP